MPRAWCGGSAQAGATASAAAVVNAMPSNRTVFISTSKPSRGMRRHGTEYRSDRVNESKRRDCPDSCLFVRARQQPMGDAQRRQTVPRRAARTPHGALDSEQDSKPSTRFGPEMGVHASGDPLLPTLASHLDMSSSGHCTAPLLPQTGKLICTAVMHRAHLLRP